VNARRNRPASRRGPPPAAGANVFALDASRIHVALARRGRYRYVRPRVERESEGWKIVSPNCSRNVDPAGGDIDIAWFLPLGEGRWLLHARDHAARAWRATCGTRSLDAALSLVCEDADRVYWP